MQQFLVSIIIPVFNRESLIKVALNSVIKQTYTNWECIVVDDGSTDGSLEILKDYAIKDSRITFFSRQRLPKGAPTCRNMGLAHANGAYVMFLDSDDYLLPFCLEQRVAAFEKHSHCDFLVFPMAEQRQHTIKIKEIPKSTNYLVKFLSADLPWQTMCPIWKRDFLIQLEGFTEGYPRLNDPELMIRGLLQPKINYMVLHEAPFDCVFIPSIKAPLVFKNNVYKSLLLFIPDVIKHLNLNRKSTYKSYLALYLHLWFKYIYIPSGSSSLIQSIRLLNMFKRFKIITTAKFLSLIFRLCIYTISLIILKSPINKLSDKSIYFMA